MRSRRWGGAAFGGPRPWVAPVIAMFFGIALSAHEGRAQPARAPVVGMVVDSVGGPIAGAQVDIAGTFHQTTTDSAGHFRLLNVEAGRLQIHVRRLGFLPTTLYLQLSASGARQVMITMVAAPEVLAPVVVAGRREVYEARLSGFESRAATRKNGHFITRERIERTNSKRLSDLLRQVPTVRVALVRGLGTMAYIRNASCPALIFIDGSPASAGPLDLDLIDLASVEGIEVYGGFGAPPEFSNVRADRCGVIAILVEALSPAPADARRARASVDHRDPASAEPGVLARGGRLPGDTHSREHQDRLPRFASQSSGRGQCDCAIRRRHDWPRRDAHSRGGCDPSAVRTGGPGRPE